MTTATLPSGTGIVSTYSYDDADRLTGITHVKGGSTTVASVAYTLDDVGNRTQSFPGRMDQQGTHTYSYDDLYRLTSVTYPGPSTRSYAYDDNDRITSVTPPSPASVINYTWDLTTRGSEGAGHLLLAAALMIAAVDPQGRIVGVWFRARGVGEGLCLRTTTVRVAGGYRPAAEKSTEASLRLQTGERRGRLVE